jgi:hypothetical protein
MLRELTVEGFINSERGKGGSAAKTLRGILGG